MWPASASTTIPSGIGPAEVTMTLLSEPSGFTERMRPPLASKKNKRGTTALRTDAGLFDFCVCVSIIVSFLVLFVYCYRPHVHRTLQVELLHGCLGLIPGRWTEL